MNKKNFLASGLGAIVHFFLGFLFYGLLFSGFMSANTTTYEGLMREESSAMNGYIISSILFAVLITYILSKVKIRNAMHGMNIGAIVTFLLACSMDAMFYFSMNLHSGMAILTDILVFTIMGAITAWVIGFMLTRKNEVVVTNTKMG